jgi:hypothetical protein
MTSKNRPSSSPCTTCGAPPAEQVPFRGPTGEAWRCRRCLQETATSLPFPPHIPPSGKPEIDQAVAALAMLVPVLRPIDDDLVYRVVRPYFDAGWCVRDVVYAINYLPDGQTHPGQGAAWVRSEHPERTLWRMQQRLRKWRFADREDGTDIMRGPYTATSLGMRRAADAQQEKAAARHVEWHRRVEAARMAEHSGAKAVARRQAVIAATLARQAKRHAEQRALEQTRQELERRTQRA